MNEYTYILSNIFFPQWLICSWSVFPERRDRLLDQSAKKPKQMKSSGVCMVDEWSWSHVFIVNPILWNPRAVLHVYTLTDPHQICWNFIGFHEHFMLYFDWILHIFVTESYQSRISAWYHVISFFRIGKNQRNPFYNR